MKFAASLDTLAAWRDRGLIRQETYDAVMSERYPFVTVIDPPVTRRPPDWTMSAREAADAMSIFQKALDQAMKQWEPK